MFLIILKWCLMLLFVHHLNFGSLINYFIIDQKHTEDNKSGLKKYSVSFMMELKDQPQCKIQVHLKCNSPLLFPNSVRMMSALYDLYFWMIQKDITWANSIMILAGWWQKYAAEWRKLFSAFICYLSFTKHVCKWSLLFNLHYFSM